MNRPSSAMLALTAGITLAAFPYGDLPFVRSNESHIGKRKRGRGGGKSLTTRGETYAERVQRKCRERSQRGEEQP